MPIALSLLVSFIFLVLGYLSGSLAFALWITRLVKKVDVRSSGSGHATTTNTFRQAGFLPAATVLVLDIAKGFLPTWLATRYAPYPLVIPLTSALVVVGHCWPVFAGFRGGMGLAVVAGCLLAISPLGFLISLGLLISLTLILHHSARASVITGLLMSPVLWLIGLRGEIIWVAAAVGLIISFRFLSDWNRKYQELWLDREKVL